MKKRLGYYKEYMMYYIDYYLSALWNVFRIWGVFTLLLILLPVPPVLWKVHAFLMELARGGNLMTAIGQSRISECPIKKDDFVK
jgi:hypothetical protein